MKILIRGAGDLATGVAYELFIRGHQILMTEMAIPLTVRRQVAFSRAVYRKSTVVEGVTAELADVYAGQGVNSAEDILAQGKIAVMVDPENTVLKEYRPDVVIDGIMAKENLGTTLTDAPLVLALGPGFTAGKDCHAVIETKRGETLGQPIYAGEAIANTGVPGMVGGYAIERLIRATADGIIEPVKHIGDIVKKGEVLAYTGGQPVYAQIDGIIRGMLQEGVCVKAGLKIGDVDPRKDASLVRVISDKARKIGVGACEAISCLCRKNCGILLLAAGEAKRYGGDKLLARVPGRTTHTNAEDKPMYQYSLAHLAAFPTCDRVVVTRFAAIAKDALDRGITVVENNYPEEGIARSIYLGMQKLLQDNPALSGVLCMVCDQPWLKTETIERIFLMAAGVADRIVCAGNKERLGNPVWFGRAYFEELMCLEGDVGGKQVVRNHPEHMLVCSTAEEELRDIDFRE